MDREAWCAIVHGVEKESDDLATEQQFIVVTITFTKFFDCFSIYLLAYLSDIQSLYIFAFPVMIFHLL